MYKNSNVIQITIRNFCLKMSKKIYIESLGCAKNQVDSEIILTIAKQKGYEVTKTAQDADLLFVNTCGFIESAKEESINTFFSLKNTFPKAKIILGGCLAERYNKELELEEADAIFGNHDLSKFADLLDELEENDEQIKLAPEYPDPDKDKDERSEYILENREYIYPLCTYGKAYYPEYSDQIVNMKYHISSICRVVESITN